MANKEQSDFEHFAQRLDLPYIGARRRRASNRERERQAVQEEMSQRQQRSIKRKRRNFGSPKDGNKGA